VYFFYYFPVGFDIKTRRVPVITIFLSLVSVITFLFYRYLPYTQAWKLTALIYYPLNPSLTTSFTHVFMHAGYIHLIGNIVYLLVFGKVIEDRFGPGRFFLIFAFSAAIGVWFHTILTGIFSPQYLGYGIVGASGATSGLLGAFMARFYFSRIRVAYWIFMPLQGVNRVGRQFVPGWMAIAFWILFQGVHSIMQFGVEGVQVAYSVHIGGFACGYLLAIAFGARRSARSESILSKARRHFKKSEWFAAQGEYINYLDQKPDDAVIYAETARAFLCTMETRQARGYYMKAVTENLRSSDRGAAEAVFAEAMRAIPGFSLPEPVHLDLAFSSERSLKYNTAMSAYKNFTARYPQSTETPFILLRMAGIHERRFHRYSDAYSCYKKLVREHPADTWADYARSEIERLIGMRVVSEPLIQ